MKTTGKIQQVAADLLQGPVERDGARAKGFLFFPCEVSMLTCDFGLMDEESCAANEQRRRYKASQHVYQELPVGCRNACEIDHE